MPMIRITTSSSIRVKPLSSLSAFRIFIGPLPAEKTARRAVARLANSTSSRLLPYQEPVPRQEPDPALLHVRVIAPSVPLVMENVLFDFENARIVYESVAAATVT